MNAAWQQKKLSDVCLIKPPKSEVRKQLSNSDLVSFAPMERLGINQKYFDPAQDRPMAEVAGSYTYFADGDVLLAKITPCFENGKLGIAKNLTNGIGFGSSEYIVFRSNSDLNSEFLYYFLSREIFRQEGTKRMTGAVGHKRVSKEFIENTLIPIPPLIEQQRIVTILDEAFEGIDTATANAEKNLRNAREVFRMYLKTVFTSKEAGWLERKISEVCTLKSGTTVSSSLEKSDGDLPYLKVADMNFAGNEVEVFSSSRFLNKMDIGKNSIFPSGTTIFPKRGGSILTNKKRLTAVPICTDLNIMGVIPSSGLHHRLVYFYFQNIDMKLLGSGSSIPQINNYDIEPLPISYPESMDRQAEIVSKLDDLSEAVTKLESVYQQKLDALAELKKSILHQAFTGQLQ